MKLLDFGLAKLAVLPDQETVTAGADATQHGVAMGTPPYMSPEQARGEAIDPRADLFSLGALLYELATGKRAFPAPFDRTPPEVGGVPRELRPVSRSSCSRTARRDTHRLQRSSRISSGSRP